MKSSQQIESDLKRHSDFGIAYSEALEALKAWEIRPKSNFSWRKIQQQQRGKLVKKATSQKGSNLLTTTKGEQD